MRENKYDDEKFFNKYKNMDRSKKGLAGAGEWHELKKILPDLKNKTLLDLGCGFGWHCKYAHDKGAKNIVGIDISYNMLKEAQKINNADNIKYECKPIENIDYEKESFDIVLSSLAIHYIKSFNDLINNVYNVLKTGGYFIFSVEHPIFTAEGNEEWITDEYDNNLHWPVDNYFDEGIRTTKFLVEEVSKYHRTMTTYLNTLINKNFEIINIIEPKPDPDMLSIPGMKDELRRPMMLIIKALKK